MFDCFATTIKGLELLLVDELKQSGVTDFIIASAGVIFKATLNTVISLNINSRIASRILIKVGTNNYKNENDIYNIAYNIEWDEWFSVDKNIKISTSAIQCDLKSLNFITLIVKDAVCDYFVSKFDKRPDVDKREPDIRIYTFLNNDTASIYIDTSGEALFKRGYRTTKQEAPIKENLAAGLIKLTQWDCKKPIIDPMCGSGTILIEAALMAKNIAPGLRRSFAFEKLRMFDKNSLIKVKEEAQKKIVNTELKIYGSDISSKALEQTRSNINKAKLESIINLNIINIKDLTRIGDEGVLLTNPPYGLRLGDIQELETLYPQISSCLKKNFFGWSCFFFSADTKISTLMRLKPSKKINILNGSLKCCLYKFEIVEGSNRNKK